jgi:hypothetical protein
LIILLMYYMYYKKMPVMAIHTKAVRNA